MKKASWVGVAGVVMLVQLLLLNGWMWWRNQRTFEKEDRPRVVPRHIKSVSALNLHDPVRYTFNMYYELRALDGATLIIPEIMYGHQFHLERVSRVKIEYVFNPPLLSNKFLDELRRDGKVTKVLHIDVSSWLDVVIVPGTQRYLLTRSVDGSFWVILPEDLYKQDVYRKS